MKSDLFQRAVQMWHSAKHALLRESLGREVLSWDRKGLDFASNVFLILEIIGLLCKKLSSTLPCEKNEWNWTNTIALVTSRHLSPSSLNKSETEILMWLHNETPILQYWLGNLSSSSKTPFWRASEPFLGMQWEDREGRGRPQVGIGEGKGKDRYWRESGEFWRQLRASWAWLGGLTLCLSLPTLPSCCTLSLATSLISSDNSSIQIIGCACCNAVLLFLPIHQPPVIWMHIVQHRVLKNILLKPTTCLTRESCVYSLLHMYIDLGLLVSHMLLSPQRRQKDCLWLHCPGGYSPAGPSLPCSILLLVCLFLPEGSKIIVKKKMPGLICSPWRQGTHSRSFKCVPEIQVRASNFRCFCSLYCQCSTCKEQFRQDEEHI